MALNDHYIHPEVAATNNRLGISRERKPLTPEELASYRPAKADPTVVDTPEVKELALLLGYIAGPNFEHKLQVARYIISLEKRLAELEQSAGAAALPEQRIAALETAQHINPAQIGVEKR